MTYTKQTIIRLSIYPLLFNMHLKNSHWLNRFRCLLQFSPVVLTSGIATDSALANPPNLLPVLQPEPSIPPKPLTPLSHISQPSLLPTPTPPEALFTSAFSLNSAIPEALSTTIIKSSPSFILDPPAFGSSQPEKQLTPLQSSSFQNTAKGTVCPKITSVQELEPTPDLITVEEFEFVVNSPVFTQAELKSFTKDFLNKPLSKAQLMRVSAEITKLYAARGYSTSIAVPCIPSQTKQLGKGTIIICVIEGELERIDVKSPSAKKEHRESSRLRLNPNYVRSRLALAGSKPLNVNKIQEAVQLLQKDPLIESANFRLLPGSSFGKSILEVEVKEAKSFSTSLSNEITGFSSLGTSQQKVTLSEANLLGIGDSLSLGYSGTELTNDWNVSYTLPLNAKNGTLSFTYTQSQSYGIPKLNASVPLKAQSVYGSRNSSNYDLGLCSYELTLRQPVRRRIKGKNIAPVKQQSIYEELALGLTAFLGDSPITSSQLPLSLSSLSNDSGLARTFALRFFQEWKKQNALDTIELRSQFSFGVNTFSSTNSSSLAQEHPLPAATFISWQGNAQWTHVLAKDILLSVRASAQLANQTLVASEQLIRQGKGSYLQDTFLADNGILASAEVQLPLLRVFRKKGVIQVIPFVDFGTAWNSSGKANPRPNTLASVGLGLQWQQDNLTARLDWEIPLVSLYSAYVTGLENGLYLSLRVVL